MPAIFETICLDPVAKIFPSVSATGFVDTGYCAIAV